MPPKIKHSYEVAIKSFQAGLEMFSGAEYKVPYTNYNLAYQFWEQATKAYVAGEWASFNFMNDIWPNHNQVIKEPPKLMLIETVTSKTTILGEVDVKTNVPDPPKDQAGSGEGCC